MQNTLGGETSPYLLQHKDNPVHWQAWGEDAFRQAREQDKPVLLSVGYAACHWCHVMAHESFEDDAIANLMNSMFVNIKVDREERPDVDAIYQAALALTGQHGGWPLTMFLTPEGEPFWGGTYFPASPKYGRPGFPDILRRVAEVYQTDKDAVSKNTAALVDALQKLGQPAEDAQEVALGADILDQVAQRLAKEVVPFLGGIGGAPKFPQSYAFETLWRAWLRTGDEVFFRAVDTTLTQMCQGGIYDHLGGGLARYSTDDRWLVPHFEKMLYDNALFIELLTTVWQSTGNPLYRQRVEETVGWVLREMLGEGGAFAASLDADSEGVEGKFYVWQEAEIDALLGAEAAPFKAAYNVGPGGNWEGSTILNRSHALQLGPPEAEASLAAARQRLLQARDARVRPGWDDKILADWNGMMIAALLHAGSALARPEWIAAAQRAFAFINERMAEGDRLRHAYRDGRIQRAAMLDDYANMARAGVLLYELTGDAQALARAEAWVATVNADYWDDTNGGYFFTAAGATDLVTRMRQCNDNAVPSGNGLMAQVLVRLFHLTGNLAHRQRAETLFQAFSGELLRNFFPLTTYLNSFELLLRPLQVVIVGARGEPEVEALLSAVNAVCLPNRILQTVADPAALPPLHPAHAKTQLEGRATAYVCLGETCSLPLAEPEALRAELQQHSR